MMKIPAQLCTVLITAFLALLAAGCDTVTTLHPLSLDAKPPDMEKFEGTWLTDDGALQIKFAGNGVAHVAGVDWKDDKFRMIQGEMIVTRGTEHNFLSFRMQEDDGTWPDEYFFCQYMLTDENYLLLWLPDKDVFANAIAAKQLQGSVKKAEYSTSIQVTSEPEVLLQFIDSPERGNLFTYREPIVLRKTAPRD